MAVQNVTQFVYEANITHPFPLRFQDFKLPRLLAVGSYCAIAIGFVSFLLDVHILVTFHRHRRLITPFTIHIINLIVIEILFLTLAGPFFILRYVDHDLFHSLPVCNVYKFFGWSGGVVQMLQSCVICGDRWLALLAPHWYRKERTVMRGVIVTVVLFLYQQVWFLPVFVVDSSNPLHAMKGAFCDWYVSLPLYWIVVQIATYLLPFFFLCVSYPVLIILAARRAGPRSVSK